MPSVCRSVRPCISLPVHRTSPSVPPARPSWNLFPFHFPVPTPAGIYAPSVPPSPHCSVRVLHRSCRAWRSGRGRRLRKTGWSVWQTRLPFLREWRGRSRRHLPFHGRTCRPAVARHGPFPPAVPPSPPARRLSVCRRLSGGLPCPHPASRCCSLPFPVSAPSRRTGRISATSPR